MRRIFFLFVGFVRLRYRLTRPSFLATALLVLGLSTSRATAAPMLLYDNGPLTGEEIGIEVFYGLGDDFRLDMDTILTHVSALTTIETWLILSGTDQSPNALLASGPVVFEPGTTRFSVGAIPLKANKTYWIAGINGNLDECIDFTGGASWALAAPNATVTTREWQHPFGRCPEDGSSGWSFADPTWSHVYFDVNENFQLAFQLYGQAVPEPASLLLLGTGGLGLIAKLRRRKQQNS